MLGSMTDQAGDAGDTGGAVPGTLGPLSQLCGDPTRTSYAKFMKALGW